MYKQTYTPDVVIICINFHVNDFIHLKYDLHTLQVVFINVQSDTLFLPVQKYAILTFKCELCRLKQINHLIVARNYWVPLQQNNLCINTSYLTRAFHLRSCISTYFCFEVKNICFLRFKFFHLFSVMIFILLFVH